MADTKISALTDGTTANSTDAIPIARSGANYYITPGYLLTYAKGQANTWTASQTIDGASLVIQGNISSAAWTTNGIRYKSVPGTLTDTSSTGTVAAAYTNVYGGNTIAASNATTFTDYFTTYINQPTAGTNVTFTNRWALGLTGNVKIAGNATIGGQTVTTSQPVIDLSQTWNAGAVTFTGLKFNATDTASASGSLLLDLQVGGASKVTATKGGRIYAAAGLNVSGISDNATLSNVSGYTTLTNLNGGSGISFTTYGGNQTTSYMNLTGTTIAVPSGAVFSWSNSTDPSATKDLFLSRATTATLQLGAADAAAPVAQTLQVQSVVAGTSNTAGTNFTINGSKGTGTGAGGSIIFQVAPAGSSGTAQNAYATALTIDAAGNYDVSSPIASGGLSVRLFTGSAGTANNNNLIRFSANSTIQGYVGYNTANGGTYGLFDSSAACRWSINASGASAGSGDFIGFASTTAASAANTDVRLFRDTSNTLALRNGTAAQKFRVYNTYTSSTSYENFEIDWQTTANIALVGPTKGSGGGTQRVQRLQYLEDGGAGSTTPSLGTTCPAASATVKSWIKVITSDGTTAYIPCWA